MAGLFGALAIIVLVNLISFLTGLSLSSVATNLRVRTGATYYLIPRTLGLEIGGAIGLPRYLSQTISVAFYIIGFTEAFSAVFSGYLFPLARAVAGFPRCCSPRHPVPQTSGWCSPSCSLITVTQTD